MKNVLTLLLLCFGGSLLMAQSDCRLKPEDIQPVIAAFNPFFTDHHWNSRDKLERARLDEDRIVVIRQRGCIRHHITFTLILRDRAIRPGTDFWIKETLRMMYAIYFEDAQYGLFQDEWEKVFAEKFQQYGLGNQFNFPLGTRNFVCRAIYEPGKGGQVTVELVKYLFKETVKQPGIPPEQDDGWFRAAN
ncbi:MAG: hypothetical protein AAGI38_08010 [Bacteroidota bacterium]